MNVLITGVSKGLGLSLTRQYLEQGHTIYGIARNRPDIVSKGFHFLPFNLGNLRQLHSSVEYFLTGVQLNAAILNAAVLSEIKNLQDTPLWEIEESMAVNTWSNKILIDLIIDRVDHICVITSGVGFRPVGGMNAYCISKAALNSMTHLYALEHTNVKFSLIDPGRMDTDMQSRLKERYTTDGKTPVNQGFILNSPDAVAKKLIKIII
jgi:benzil reductase ((S)-benzoin forming)